MAEQSDPKSVKNVITKGEATAAEKIRTISICDCKATTFMPKTRTRASRCRGSTPLRYSASLNYESEHWTASIEGQRVSRPYRHAEFETSTPGYTFLNVSLGYKFRWGPTYNFVYLRGTNLTDEEARDHLSF